jgi:hypothetical protein
MATVADLGVGQEIRELALDEPLGCLSWCQISSAVSAVLRSENISLFEAAGAEQCGYGDLR